MKYPDCFYYEETQSAQKFQSRATGYPEVSRMIKGEHNCWRSPYLFKERFPKKLILADWNATNWLPGNIFSIKKALEKLIDHGFDLYLWQSGLLHRVKTQDLWYLEVSEIRSAITPPDDWNDVSQAATEQHRLASDKIHILDNEWVNYLLSDDESSKPYLSLHDFANIASSEHKLVTSHHKTRSIPSFVRIDDRSEKATNALQTLKSLLPEIQEIEDDCCYLEITQSFIDGIDENSQELYSITARKVKHLSFGCINVESLKKASKFLGLATLLESFRFQPNGDINLNTILYLALKNQPIVFERMKEIFISYKDLHPDFLKALLLKTPNLEYLMIDEIKGTEILNAFDGVVLNSLNTLILKVFGPFTSDNLDKLHKVAPQIKKLELPMFSGTWNMLENSLPNIEIFTIRHCPDFTIKDELSILNSMPNIKSFYYSSVKQGRSHIEVTNPIMNSLPFLEYLRLEPTYKNSISSDYLYAILKHAPNIKVLDLIRDKHFGSLLSNAPKGSFSLLQKLTLLDCNANKEDICRVLRDAPDLKELSINGGIICGQGLFENFEAGCLPNLQKVMLVNTGCGSDIEQLFKAAPNLKIIALKDVEPGVLSKIDAKNFSHLERFYLLNCTFHEDLIHILQSTTNLVTLGCNRNQFFKEELDDLRQKSSQEEIISWAKAIVASSHALSATKSQESHAHRTDFLDADTTFKQQTFQCDQIFYPLGSARQISPEDYRLKVYQLAFVNPVPCSLETAFTISNSDDLMLSTRPIEKSLVDVFQTGAIGESDGSVSLYYVKQKIQLNAEWQALASITPRDDILRYHIEPPGHIDIQYSARDNLYYVRSVNGLKSTVEIDFLVRVPEPEQLPESFSKYKAPFLNFTAGELDLQAFSDGASGEDYVKAILSQQKGACRHRAFAFKWLMKTHHPEMDVRIIMNDCHAFVEIRSESSLWYRCDLGGYEAMIEIKEPYKPKKPGLIPDGMAATSTPEALKSPDFIHYMRALATWDSHKPLKTQALAYYQQCLSSVTHYGIGITVKNRLIYAADSDRLYHALLTYCLTIKRPMFYVHSPDDLLCPASNMFYRPDGSGELRRERHSPIYQFLSDRQKEKGVIVVNYDNFKPDDFVRFNTLLDAQRSVDGIEVPDSMLIIGLLTQNSKAHRPGQDMISRFDEVETCPLTKEDLADSMPSLYDKTPSERAPDTQSINLYGADDWEERLVGRWVPQDGGWFYQNGELHHALSNNPSAIEIQNGLWDNNDFCRFWREARHIGSIAYPGGIINIPENTMILRVDGLNLETRKDFCQQDQEPSIERALILNTATFSDFFGQYEVDEWQQIHRLPGHIAAQAMSLNKECFVHLTQSLVDNEWGILLDECQKHAIKLRVFCASGAQLPLSLRNPVVQPSKPHPAAKGIRVIESTDTDTTVKQLLRNDVKALVVDVSELEDYDLFWRIDSKMIDKPGLPLQLAFYKIKCDVLSALEQGQSVILKGRVSIALANQLASLLLTKQAPGELTVVSKDTSAFDYILQEKHKVTVTEKRAALSAQVGEIPSDITESMISEEPLSSLEARLRFMQRHPGISSDEMRIGLDSLPDAFNDPGELSLTHAARKAAEFHQDRLTLVLQILEVEPYVFLTGLSGVGKTTFVTEALCKHGGKLYREESELLDWARNQTKGERKYLFFDEANLSRSDWSIFEGLFNEPPVIIIRGQRYELSKDHKVIFAGNPVNYGDERKIAPFFKRHGNACLFKPIPSSVLYNDILLPVFEGTAIADTAPEISQYLLEIYRYTCRCSKTDVLISPRELQMMALLTLSYCSKGDNYKKIWSTLTYFAHALTKPLLPIEKQAEFSRLFSPGVLAPNAQTKSDHYLSTPSREPAKLLLEEFLRLQSIRRAPNMNSAQTYGGLGGFILEGKPGIGKSEIVLHTLIAMGYEKQDFLFPKKLEKPFYHMPVGMSIEDKTTLLIQAFDTGAVVVIDEINSSPMMEQLLNALLMGKTPDGKMPTIPGFMIIGTQNPISMAGRRAASTAMARRTSTLELPPYPRDEILAILISKGLKKEDGDKILSAYETQQAFAKSHCLKPEPSFRDLMRLVKYLTPPNPIASIIEEYKENPAITAPSLLVERQTAIRSSDRYEFFGENNRAISSASNSEDSSLDEHPSHISPRN